MLQKIVKKLNKNSEPFSLAWILFLGVLPFDKAALTLYCSSAMGTYLSMLLNLLTLLYVTAICLNSIIMIINLE